MTAFTINGFSFDPSDPSRQRAWSDTDSRYVLIQTDGSPSKKAWAELANAGFEVHEHVGADTYLGAYTGNGLEALRETDTVLWAATYPVEFKIAPSLRDTEEARAPAYHRSPLSTGTDREVDVVLHADVDPGSGIQARIADVAGLDPGRMQTGVRKFRLVVPASALADIAVIDEVRQIEEVFASGVGNNVAGQIIHAGVVVNGTPYEGDGEVIAIADTGFDKGSTTNVHGAFTNRVARLYDLGRTGMTNDPDGHGTHVAGSALGDGISSSMGGQIRGTAPQARLVLQSMLDSAGGLNGGIPADLHDLFRPPYDDDGARVHSNSWGLLDPGLPYNTRSNEIDDFAWTHQDLVILFLAGNCGTDGDSDGVVEDGQIGAEAAAKNAITVGASESNRGSATWLMGTYVDPRRPTVKFLADPIKNDKPCDDAEGMAAFSSRGPTRDGRYKPDVVAPGTCILSTRSRDVPATTTNSWGTSTDNLYWFDSGTSMATPLVAGCAAVLRETLVKNGWASPPSALIKALLINGAVELGGQFTPSEAGPSPNYESGWGLVDLAGSVIIPGPGDDAGIGTGGPMQESGQEDHFRVHVPGSTFKMTLVWTDPAGATLQNDLDLIVRASNGEERHGNMGTSSELFDRVNNVEQIYWEHVPSGDLDITIRAHRILPQFPQSYAWVWRLWS